MLKIDFNPIELKYLFNHKIRELCKSCKRYGKKTCCPPNVESIEYYRQVLSSYKHGLLLIEHFAIPSFPRYEDWWKRLGKESSLVIHKKLLSMRTFLLEHGKFAIIFGAGSCKNCENCSNPCRFPEKMAIPIEATGLDVIKLIKYLTNIELKFPIQTDFYRIGMILWD